VIVSTITYNYTGIFSQLKSFHNYTLSDIFNELSFPVLLYVNVMNTSYARTKFKFYHGRLIRSYNITMGHQLLGLVCTVDSSTFH